MKKLLAGILAFSMLFTVNVFAEEETETDVISETVNFTDVNSDTENYDAILKMYNAGYIKGYNDGSFKPEGNITRAELVVMLNNIFNYNDIKEYTKEFTDVNKENWFYDAVMKGGTAGYITGFPDGSFLPNNNFTRQQFCVVLSQINNFERLEFDKEITDEVSPWASEYVYNVLSNRVMFLEDNDTFRSVENITRGEVCAALAGFIVEDDETKDEIDETTDATTSDENTETTTQRRTSSGSGGGSSSSSKNTTTETTTQTVTASDGSAVTTESVSQAATNKEASTQSTTKKQSSTQSTTKKQSSTQSTTKKEASTQSTTSKTQATTKKEITTQTTTETTTEATTKKVLSNDELKNLRKVIKGLNTVANTVNTSGEKELILYVKQSINSYMLDTSYDYKSDMDEARNMIAQLSQEEKEDLKNKILSSVDIVTLNYLMTMFGLM